MQVDTIINKEKLGRKGHGTDGEDNGHRTGESLLGLQLTALEQQRHQHHAAAPAEQPVDKSRRPSGHAV